MPGNRGRRLVSLGLTIAGAFLLAHTLGMTWVTDPAVQSGCGETRYAAADVDGNPTLFIEVAATAAERQRGLMFRESLDWDRGMLFIFDAPTRSGFWMHDTLVPLSIAWLDENGTIVDVQDMEPLSDEVHTPAAPYVMALEANQGWFAASGVEIGQRIRVCLP